MARIFGPALLIAVAATLGTALAPGKAACAGGDCPLCDCLSDGNADCTGPNCSDPCYWRWLAQE